MGLSMSSQETEINEPMEVQAEVSYLVLPCVKFYISGMCKFLGKLVCCILIIFRCNNCNGEDNVSVGDAGCLLLLLLLH